MPSTRDIKATTPAFVVDSETLVRNSGRQIDWANVADSFRSGAVVVTVAAAAALAATTVTVNALPGALPAGAVLRFSADEYATLTAAAAAGATSIATEPLVGALEIGDTATYAGAAGKKVLPAGTVVGELLGAGKISPRVATTNPATGILEATAIEDEASHALTGYGVLVGGVFYENLLPDATGTGGVGGTATLPAAIVTELRSGGVGYTFEPYGNTAV